jgi:hypothetical protein
MVALLVACRADQKVIAHSHYVAGQLQMLAGTTVGVVQPIHKVCHIVDSGLFFFRVKP